MLLSMLLVHRTAAHSSILASLSFAGMSQALRVTRRGVIVVLTPAWLPWCVSIASAAQSIIAIAACRVRLGWWCQTTATCQRHISYSRSTTPCSLRMR